MTQTQYIAFLNRIEAKYGPKVLKALMAISQDVIKDLYNHGPQGALTRLKTVITNERIAAPVERLYREVGMASARMQYRKLRGETKVETKAFGWPKAWLNDILNYFNEHAFRKLVLPTAITARERIAKVLEDGINERKTISEMTRELGDTDLLKSQARRIVRTEVVSAFGKGQQLAGDSFEYESEKVWTEIKDARTRLSHRHASGVGGQRVGMDERFTNGLLHPGDKSGRAAEVINCRCRLNIVAVRDERGRLIPKKPTIQRIEEPNINLVIQ